MGKPERHVFVCVQSRPSGHPKGSCGSLGSADLLRAFQDAFEADKLWGRFAVTPCGCLGPCSEGPNVLIYPEGILYAGVRPEDVQAIIQEHLLAREPVTRLFASPEVWSNAS